MENTLSDKIRVVANKARELCGQLKTEEATKTGLVMPLFAALGYNVFDPTEFDPEYTADVGVKRGEKVDYAIIQDGEPRILVECKTCGEVLDGHGSQLFRYFSTTKAKFGILTDGITYRFFTDLDEDNVMDLVPFLELNLLDLRDSSIDELAKFAKPTFDAERVFSRAEELKYSGLVKAWLMRELDAPSDEFVRLALADAYDGLKTKKVIDRYKPLVKRVYQSVIDDMVKRRLTAALETERGADKANEGDEPEAKPSKIITTDDEIEAFHIVRGLLAGSVPTSCIHYRDAESYFSILYDNNNRKPICRLHLDGAQKFIRIPDAQKKFTRHDIDSLDGILTFKDELISIARYWHESAH